MHRIFIPALFLMFLVSAEFLSASPLDFRIAGVVVDSVSGAPLDGAEVTIAPAGNPNETLLFRTSADGKFLFAGLVPGKYRITAVRSSYTQQGLDQHEGFMTAIAVGPKLDSEHVRFRLFRESVIAGNVSNEYGEPVRDAQVFLFQRKIFSGLRTARSIAQATTDDLGNYRFAHLAPATYSVAVHATPWYARGVSFDSSLRDIDYASASDLADTAVTLAPMIKRSLGDQRDATGSPPSPAPNPLLDVVYPTSFFSNADTLEAATPISLAPGATAPADFSLHAVPALHLFVKMPSEFSMGSRQGTAEDQPPDETGPSLEVSFNLAGEDFGVGDPHPSPQLPGYYEVSGVPPGQVVISVSSLKNGQTLSQAKTVQVSSDSQVDLIPQSPLVSVSGSISSYAPPAVAADEDGEPYTPQIKFTTQDGRSSYSASIGTKGEFAISLPAGQLQVDLAAESRLHLSSLEATGASISGHTITLSPGSPAKLTVHIAEANCTVTGTALKNGQRAAGVMILLVPEDSSQSSTLFHRDQSDSDGSFTLGQVLPGRYTLLAIENGWDLEWSNLSVLFQYLPNGIPITLKPGASLSANPKVQ